MTVTAMMGIPAVIPLIPLLPSFLAVCGWLLLTLIGAFAALRNRDRSQLIARFLWRQKIGVAVILGGVGAVGLLLTREPDFPPISTPSLIERPNVDWPSSRGGASRTGVLPGSPGPDRGEVLWTAASGYLFYSSAATDGERVYGCGFRGNSGRLFCWEAGTGRLLWTVSPPGYQASVSSPVLAGDLLMIGEGLHDTRRGRVLAVDLRPGHEGKTVWEFETQGHVESTPTVTDGRVYFGAGDDGIYCLRAERDIGSAPRLVWHLPGDRYPDVEASILACRGQLVAGLGRDGNAVCLLDSGTGEEVARQSTRHPVFSTPGHGGDHIVFGTAEGDYRNSGAGPGQVWCLDQQSFEPRWIRDVGSSVLEPAAIQNGIAYCGTGDGRLVALRLSDGKLVAERHLGASVLAAPAVTSHRVYVVTENGFVTCCTAEELSVLWRIRLSDAGPSFCSPTIAGGRLFVGTSNGFFAIGSIQAKKP